RFMNDGSAVCAVYGLVVEGQVRLSARVRAGCRNRAMVPGMSPAGCQSHDVMSHPCCIPSLFPLMCRRYCADIAVQAWRPDSADVGIDCPGKGRCDGVSGADSGGE